MVGQAPSQNGTPSDAPSNSGVPSRVLLEDPIFRPIHDAFQMGWNIIELKSRLQLASVSSNITGTPTTIPANRSVNSTQTQELIQRVLPNVANAQSKLLQPEAGIIQAQPATTTTLRLNLTDLPESTWSTSRWRATFNCIADSHKNCFPDSSTEDTYYDLPNPPDPSKPPHYQSLVTNSQGSDAASIHLPYYYLYPGNEKDYANVGIPQDDQFPDKFKLYDVTRRALNCLTLLYTNPEDSLIPLTVSYYQQQLLQNISSYKELAATLISNTSPLAQPQANPDTLYQSTAPQGTGAAVEQSGTGPDTANAGDLTVLPPEQQRTNAIQLVSNHTMRYLENWDSFARETLYVSGSGVAQSNEMQLVSYEAGRAMSSLSWAISTATVQLEDAISQTEEIETLLRRAWLKVFDEPTIASLQHQISALSTAMDGAYYRVHTDVPHPNVNNAQATQNLDLPSQSIQAITYSLEYWKRAVKKICGEDNHLQNTNQPDVTPSLTKNTPQAVQNPPQSAVQNQGIPSTIDTPTAAGTAQSSLPFSQSEEQAQSSTSMNVVPQTQPPATTSQTKAQNNGLPGTQQGGTTQSSAIPKLSSQTSSQLRQALIKQTQVWQPLVLHQQSLQDFTMSYVTQRIWNDFMQEFEQATSKGVFNTVEKNFRRYLIPIIAGIAVLILILGFSVFLLLHFPGLQQSLVTTFVLVIGSVVGFFGTTAGRVRSFSSTAPADATAALESAGPIAAIAGIAGTGLIDAFQNGYHQIQTEFDYLDHNVSVTYPLVEFFVSNSIQPATIKNAQSSSPANSNSNQRRFFFFSRSSKTNSKQSTNSGIATDAGNAINNAYDFLTQIVWTDQDRAEEIARITRATLGPIGALIGAQNQS